MNANRVGAALIGAVIAALLVLPAATSRAEGLSLPRGEGFVDTLLAMHNRERTRLGEAPLVWSGQLASDAQNWADHLAGTGTFAHMNGGRSGAGENIWRGTAGYYSTADMVGSFIDERTDFRPGRFPNVSKSGSWHDIGHYTQIIWPDTRMVGCAVARGQGEDVMVCRYWPAGNVIGKAVP
jgi:uncharacterized protein YkwD